MKRLFVLAATLFCLVNTKAQTDTAANHAATPRNAWFVEAGGLAIAGASFNYERDISKTPGGLTAHIGFGSGYVHYAYNNTTTLHAMLTSALSYNIPVSANRQHFVELGYGNTIIINGAGCGCMESAIAGYRYISPSGKLLLRATFIPYASLVGTFSRSIIWAGISLGRTF